MKIAIRQSVNGNKDPVLTITVTNHSSYLRDLLIIDDPKDALTKIERWLRNKLNDPNLRGSLENDSSQIQRGG